MQIEGIGAAHVGVSQPDWVECGVPCHFWVRCCSTSREIDGVATGAGRPVELRSFSGLFELIFFSGRLPPRSAP